MTKEVHQYSSDSKRSSIYSQESQSDYSISSLECEPIKPNTVATTFRGFENEKQVCTVTVIGDNTHIGNIYNDYHSEICEKKLNEAKTDEGSDEKIKYSSFKRFFYRKSTHLAVFLLILVVLGFSAVLVSFTKSISKEVPKVLPQPGHDDDLGDGIQIIKREEWIAQPPLKETKFSTPPGVVIIRHTAGSSCIDYQTCSGKVLALQGWQVGVLAYSDIASNFLIGGDGNVYCGRGPDLQNQWHNDSIDISYIGNYIAPYHVLSDKMEEAGKRLIAKLANESKISPDYQLISHNQTYKTQSPGENIYSKIIHWPHYNYSLFYGYKKDPETTG